MQGLNYVHAYLQMTSLRELDLSGNLLTELPTSLATLPKLEVRARAMLCAAVSVPLTARQLGQHTGKMPQQLTSILGVLTESAQCSLHAEDASCSRHAAAGQQGSLQPTPRYAQKC